MPSALNVRASNIRVRVAGINDAATLAELCAEHAAFERAPPPPTDLSPRLLSLLTSTEWRAWLAEESGHAIGFCSGEVQTSTWRGARFWHLDCLYLRPTQRGRGIGAALLDACLEHARAEGLGWAEWQTPEWNARAIRFYRKRGATASVKQRFVLALI